MHIKDLFSSDVTRRIEEVIQVDQKDEEVIRDEINEYVVTDAISSHYTSIFDAYREVVERREPLAAELFAPWFGCDFYYYERFLAPLCPDGGPVTMIFGALHSVDEPDTA